MKSEYSICRPWTAPGGQSKSIHRKEDIRQSPLSLDERWILLRSRQADDGFSIELVHRRTKRQIRLVKQSTSTADYAVAADTVLVKPGNDRPYRNWSFAVPSIAKVRVAAVQAMDPVCRPEADQDWSTSVCWPKFKSGSQIDTRDDKSDLSKTAEDLPTNTIGDQPQPAAPPMESNP